MRGRRAPDIGRRCRRHDVVLAASLANVDLPPLYRFPDRRTKCSAASHCSPKLLPLVAKRSRRVEVYELKKDCLLSPFPAFDVE